MSIEIIGIIQSIILGIVEGVTEFLPVSSTGHLIVAGELLSFTGEKAKVFDIFIQLGAILAVVWYYRVKIVTVVKDIGGSSTNKFIANLFIAFLPVAIIGLLIHSWIKQYLFNPSTVALALIVGGILILVIERSAKNTKVYDTDNISLKSALLVGIAQVLSLFPGVSRAAATIMGGLVLGFDRKTATEFSFFLAIPTMFAATTYDLLKNLDKLSVNDLPVFAIGFIVAFISAFLVVGVFLKYVIKHNFTLFAYYRIIFGVVILLVFQVR